jgi:two-component system cell cycle response regulator DivK
MARVLVVEDNPANMKLVVFILTNHGHEVITAENAYDGINLAKLNLPDLVLMDIQLPDMDGLTATQLLKQDQVTKHLPIFALTAFAMKGDEDRILKAGCDGYITKPIQHQEFMRIIAPVLNSSAIHNRGD